MISELDAAGISGWDCDPGSDGVQPPPGLVAALELDREVGLNLELKRPTIADADVYVAALLAYDAECGACLAVRLTLQSFEWAAEQLDFRVAILDVKGELDAIAEAAAFADIWSPQHELVNPELLADVHALGMRVIPWTVNERGRMLALIELGVDGLITDYPDVLLGLLGRAP